MARRAASRRPGAPSGAAPPGPQDESANGHTHGHHVGWLAACEEKLIDDKLVTQETLGDDFERPMQPAPLIRAAPPRLRVS